MTVPAGSVRTMSARSRFILPARFRAYGPIRAGADGLHYFTLRNGWDPGARYMPEARTELPRPRRHRVAMAELSREPEAGCESVLGPEADGLAAWRWRLADRRAA